MQCTLLFVAFISLLLSSTTFKSINMGTTTSSVQCAYKDYDKKLVCNVEQNCKFHSILNEVVYDLANKTSYGLCYG